MTEPKCPNCKPDDICEVHQAMRRRIDCQGDVYPKGYKERQEALDELTAQAQEMGLYDRFSNSVNTHIQKSIEEESFVAFPFGPIPHWIKCANELPPNDMHKEILIFNLYKEMADGPLFERTFVWLANTFKHNSGCLSLNHFYTWWMHMPETPHWIDWKVTPPPKADTYCCSFKGYPNIMFCYWQGNYWIHNWIREPDWYIILPEPPHE
jgi:hypothetical protein